MMVYEFGKNINGFGRVVFALSLDKKRMRERIVIGKEHDVKSRLADSSSEGAVYYDETRPLGSLLINFESDKNGDWNTHHMILRESYGKERLLPILERERWKMVAPVVEFLQAKFSTGEPSAMFAAIRTWENYLNFHNKNDGSDSLTSRLSMLYKPFKVYRQHKPWEEKAVSALSVAIRDGESQVELWYPVGKRPFETVVAVSSFLPVIFYYRHKVEEWGFVFQRCKVCEKYFLARSKHYYTNLNLKHELHPVSFANALNGLV